MAEELELVKISELPDASNVTATDVFPVVQNNVTKKVTAPIIRKYVVDSLGSAAKASISDFEPSGSVLEVDLKTQERADEQNKRIDRIEVAAYLLRNNKIFKAYRTKALMLADVANIPANSLVHVVNDPGNNAETNDINGQYHYDGNDFLKLPDDILSLIDTKSEQTKKEVKAYANQLKDEAIHTAAIDAQIKADDAESTAIATAAADASAKADAVLEDALEYVDSALKKYFQIIIDDPEFLLVITDNVGNRLLAIDRSGYTHLNLTQEYTDTVKPSDTTYQSLVSLLSLLGNITTDPENLFVVSDASKNTLLKIGRDGMISGNFNIGYSDLLNTPQAPLQLGLGDSSGIANPHLFKISDYSGNILLAIFKDGTVDIPYLSSSNLQVDTINSVLSILEQNASARLTTQKKVNVTHQGYMRLKVEALNFPTDTTGQVGTKGTVLFCNPTETEQYLKCNVEMFVQGASSANDFKKGYTFDLYNSNNEELGVKFGDMISSSSFHLKAFYRDPTHTRDQAGYRFWKSLAETLDYPYCKINNSIYAQSTTRSDKAEFTFDAKYYPHGFPVEIYLNDTFHGLYTLRLKKTRENYALNNADLNHIFLDNAEYRARLNTSFNYAQWEIKSPKMKGYSDQGPIPATFPTVQAAIDSLFNFTKSLSANYANHATVLNLPHWVLFYILAELTGHWDIDGNNYNIFTWDGVHWSILPYDMDLTLNWYRNSGVTQTGFLINVDIWQTFRTVYSNEIKAMWTKFRNEKSLTIEKVVNTYRTVAKDIPREVYVADKAKWGLATDFTGNDYPNIEQIYRYIAARIAYLDSQWSV